MVNILKKIILFMAWLLIGAALLGLVALVVYLLLFLYHAVFNHAK